MSARRVLLASAALLSAAALHAASVAAQVPPITVAASQRVIRITARYQGDLVHVQGTARPSSAVVLELTSPREVVLCSQKGQVGPFWLSVRQVRFGNVPSMYKIKSSAPLDDILPRSERIKYGLGRAGLKESMTVDAGVDKNLYLDELILIRQRAQRFSFTEEGVGRDGDTYEASFFWPPDGPPGRYRIVAYAVEGGRIVGTAETEVDVQTVGVEAWLRDLAANHGILYGLFAVGLAAAAGLGVSLLLGRRGSGPSSTSPEVVASGRMT
ncbi:MAG: TIGR02186 family protein [Gemmatimonadetes bacterium]|nr:TIGR02186 family protein [Gemmatimonadota bacterium]